MCEPERRRVGAMAFDELMGLTNRLLTSAQALAAVTALLRLDELGVQGDPAVRAQLERVVDALGVGGLDELDASERSVLVSFARSTERTVNRSSTAETSASSCTPYRAPTTSVPPGRVTRRIPSIAASSTFSGMKNAGSQTRSKPSASANDWTGVRQQRDPIPETCVRDVLARDGERGLPGIEPHDRCVRECGAERGSIAYPDDLITRLERAGFAASPATPVPTSSIRASGDPRPAPAMSRAPASRATAAS
ncbi:hypothetical protein BH20ACT13_BH20ACT13_12940 [soil metagenome]